MIVSLNGDNGLHVEQATDFNAFSFAAPAGGLPDDSEGVVIRDGAAWISESELRAWPDLAGSPAWQDGLSAMIRYAASRGWIDAASGRIRAHIEPG